MTGSTRSYEFSKRLVKKGHKVSVITTWRESRRERKFCITNEDGIEVHWIPVEYSNHLGFLKRIVAFIKFAISASYQASLIKADIIFATSTPLTVSIPAMFASRKNNLPFIFEVRDLWPEIPIAIGVLRNPLLIYLARKLEKLAYNRASAIVALSPGMKDGIVEVGIPENKVSVIPNGSDTDFFGIDDSGRDELRKHIGLNESDSLILYAGTLGKINGVKYMVQLAAAVKAVSNIKFLIVGDGKEFNEVVEYAKELGCYEENMFLWNSVPKQEMPKILSAADISVSLTIPIIELEANSANKVFDAFAAGRCVAVNHGGWIKELIEVERCGFFLPQDIGLARETLLEWTQDQEKLRSAGNRARLLAEKSFARDLLADQLEEVFVNTYLTSGGTKC